VLRLYPRRLRERYGEEMVATFEAARLNRGGWRRVWYAVRAMWDVVRSSAVERRSRRSAGDSRRRRGRGEFGTDLRIAARSLGRTPLFTLSAVVVLALGIGANGALFSALRATVFGELAYPEADRLVLLDLTESSTLGPVDAGRAFPWSWPKFEVLEETAGRLADPVAAYATRTVTLAEGGEPARLTMEVASPDYFDVLGVRPAVGREFAAADEAEGVLRAVLSDGLWRGRFGGSPAVLGRVVAMSGKPVEVIGVAPAGFRGLSGRADLWVTIHTGAALVAPFLVSAGQAHWLSGIGRLVPGAAIESLRAQMQAVGKAAEAAYPDPDPTFERSGDARLLRDARVTRDARRAVLVLTVAAGLVLLIACANLAGLLLARASRRGRETAVRLALGGGRWRVARAALAESLLLAGAGGAAGVVVAWAAAGWIVRAWPERFLDGGWNLRFVDAQALGPDWSVLLASGVLALLTGALCGLAPALAATRSAPAGALRAGPDGRGPRRGLPDTRSLLVGLELAAALVLLAGTGLMVASFRRLQHVDRGIDTRNVLSFQWSLPRGSTWAPADFQAALLEGLARIPGVAEATIGCSVPLGGHCMITRVSSADGREIADADRKPIGVQYIAANYFETLGARLLRGQLFDGTERPDTRPVVILSRQAAETFFPDGDALGGTLTMGADPATETPAEVIGIVDDILYDRPEQGTMPEAYFSFHQVADGTTGLVRGTTDPLALVPAIRGVVQSLDPELPIFSVRTLADMEARATGDTRIVLTLLVAFAVLALVLAATGIWAVVAYAVSLRRREMGIRMALGAGPRGIVRLVVRRAVGIVSVGVAAGLLASWWLTRLLQAMLFDVRPDDRTPLLAAASMLAAVALFAAWLPARGATRVDPLETLRAD
jgi:predicted permease